VRGVPADAPMLCGKAGAGKPVLRSRLAVCELCDAEVWLPLNVFGVDRIWCWDCAGPEIERMKAKGEEPPFGEVTLQIAAIAARRRV